MNQNQVMQGGMQQQGISPPVMPPNPPTEVPPAPPEPRETPLRAMLEAINIAEKLDEDTLTKIGSDAKEGYEADCASRKEWENNVKEWTKLAIQCREEKSYPWPRASNVKYPLLSTAAMQFAARAYPSLVPSDGQVVKAQVIGKDFDGTKQDRAERVSTYMSYQLTREMKGWEEDMDKLLIMLPVVGTVFKKTYYDPIEEQPCSQLILPLNLIVNYWTRCLEECERISEIIEMSPRLLKERQNAGIFLDVDLGQPQVSSEHRDGYLPQQDATTPYNMIEQHTFIDLDEDGYPEPYIVTFEEESGTVVRIAARYDEDGIKTAANGDLIKIDPIHYYTKFGFIPNPDGSFYDIGFGVLLGPINESVNTLINQLVDSGSLNNLQSGFIGKGLRIRMGEQQFSPGEWKAVNATADDLRKQIFPLPTKEPSTTLFQLMGSLITSGKELASVADIFTGKMPGQNTPATTTMATVEQGMKVFTAVYKRIYRSLAEEFEKLFRINEVYLDPQTYAEIVDVQVGPQDFSKQGYDICPGADPSAVSQTEKLLKAQGLMELLPMGILDPMEVTKRILEAQEQPNIDRLIHPQAAEQGGPVQQPDPKQLEMQMKQQAEQQKAQVKQQEIEMKMALEQRSAETKVAMEKQLNDQKLQFEAQKATLQASADLHKQRIFAVQEQQKMNHNEQNHQQKMAHAEQSARTKNKQETQKSAQSRNSKTGKTR